MPRDRRRRGSDSTPARVSVTKLYLHAAASTVGGTLPPSGGLQSSGDKSGTDANTNKSMNDVKGVSQASTNIVSLGTISGQNLRLARFCSGLLVAQAIPAQTITVHMGAQQSAAAANVRPAFQLFLWRPSNGTKVANLVLGPRDAGAISGTAEVAATTSNFTSTLGTAIDGDILVCELWVNASQADTGTYTDTLFFDGTTEDDATSNAAFVAFATAVGLQ